MGAGEVGQGCICARMEKFRGGFCQLWGMSGDRVRLTMLGWYDPGARGRQVGSKARDVVVEA